MSTQHPVFVRRVGDKAIVTTILDLESLNLDEKDSDNFFMAVTAKHKLTDDNPIMTIIAASKTPGPEFVKQLGLDKDEQWIADQIKGNSINGILRLPIWFCKKTKTLTEQFYGK